MDTVENPTSGKMDFLPLLPSELILKITKGLSIYELGRLFRVSKAWYKMINADIIWYSRCLDYGFRPNEPDYLERDEKSILSDWARIWRDFRTGPAFAWGSNRWEDVEVDFDWNYTANFYDDKSIVFKKDTTLFLHRTTDPAKTEYKFEIPSVPSLPWLPYGVCNDYVVVVLHNIILAYKLCEQEFKCIWGVAKNEDTFDEMEDLIVSDFVRDHLRISTSTPRIDIDILTIKEDCTWFQEGLRTPDSKIFMMDLKKKEILKFSIPTEMTLYKVVVKHHILFHSPTDLWAYEFTGRNVLKIKFQPAKRFIGMFYVSSNKNVVVACSVDCDFDKILETWDFVTGRRLFSLPFEGEAFLHPTLPTLYLTYHSDTTITSMCAITGQINWITSCVPSPRQIGRWCTLSVVCRRYLVVATRGMYARHAKELIVHDSETGQFMYRTERPHGMIMTISDNVLITEDPRFIVRKFINLRDPISAYNLYNRSEEVQTSWLHHWECHYIPLCGLHKR